MTNRNRFRPATGFSLIEVLLAVVVLSIGLLALAALQMNVVRSSAEAKSRTTGLALAEDKLEQIRNFTLRSSSTAACPAVGDANWPEQYRCIAAPGAAEQLPDVDGSLGGTDYSRNWRVERYVWDSATELFVSLGAVTADDTAVTAASATYRPGTEFKRVMVDVSWTDAEGDAKLVSVEDVVSSMSPAESSRVRSQRENANRGPQVLITNPEGTPGVIPIAIGGGTETAATNPRPEVAGRQNDQRVVETRFDVLTYAALSNSSNALVQSRIETAVVGCTCVSGTGPSPRYRPTFWSGERYAAPDKVASSAPAAHKSLGNNDPPESRLCTECCRDHHDQGFSGETFSPRRGSHTHNIVNNEYPEACRLIRVDGIFRVAADAYNDYGNLLETANSADDFFPSAAGISNYQGFVLDYLDDRIVSAGSGAYNTILTSAETAALESTHSLNNPSKIQIQASGDFKWLHNRGLYIDWLEPAAIQKINDAKSNCDTSQTTIEACVLEHVPFTSINVTELANWTPASGTQIVVTNNDFLSSLASTEPVRGKAESISGTDGRFIDAIGAIFNSNSGLALLLTPVHADEVLRSDSQTFQIVGSSGGGLSGTYTVTFNGYTFSTSSGALPTITSDPASVCNFATTGATKPNPYTCSSSSLGGQTILTIGNYNYERSASVTETITCSGASGDRNLSVKYDAIYCRNYSVDSATVGAVSGVVGLPEPSDGVMAERTSIEFSAVNPSDAISVFMSLQGETQTPVTCTYVPQGQGFKGTATSANCP
ncbi:MAG TPA: type IV pilus modification protein PilV [Xanthomonadaceae bacterium]|nr:type IV pilus modification protein PilV [Xanthomonadaceae bacterium]